MKVAKWGNSLAIRIPADVARTLQLRVGDQVTVQDKANVQVAGKDTTAIEKDASREELLARVRALQRPMPKDWIFRRADLYED